MVKKKNSFFLYALLLFPMVNFYCNFLIYVVKIYEMFFLSFEVIYGKILQLEIIKESKISNFLFALNKEMTILMCFLSNIIKKILRLNDILSLIPTI